MPIIVFPLGLNVTILAAAWMSQLLPVVKMLITAIVVVKLSPCFYSVLVSGGKFWFGCHL